MDFIKTIYKDTLFRNILLCWAMLLISFITVMTFAFPQEIPNSMIVAYGSGLTIFTGAVGLYEYLREKDNKLYEDQKED